MPLVTSKEMLQAALEGHFAVGAFNANNMEQIQGIIDAADEEKSPVILQVSQGAIEYAGLGFATAMVKVAAEEASVPVALHLDHCPDPEFAKECLRLGWNSVLFDGSALNYDENFRITREIADFAAGYGAHVEGEVVPMTGVEDDIGSDEEAAPVPFEKDLEFIRESGIYCYAPAIGTAHGFYKNTPRIRYEHMEKLVNATHMPMVLHGGSGLDDDVFHRLIALGAAKVNISTDLKKTYADGFRKYLEAKPTEYNPLKLIGAVRDDVIAMARHYFRLFGSEGKA